MPANRPQRTKAGSGHDRIDIRDRDGKFTRAFHDVFRPEAAEVLVTPDPLRLVRLV
jgi:hypothetical protein